MDLFKVSDFAVAGRNLIANHTCLGTKRVVVWSDHVIVNLHIAKLKTVRGLQLIFYLLFVSARAINPKGRG